MTLWTIVRHGTTEWMEEDRLHGSTDSPLSERGRQEAARTAAWLARQPPFDALYSSPAGRCLETARFFSDAVGLEVLVHPALVEMDFGRLEGRRLPDLELPGQNWREQLERIAWYPWFRWNTERWRKVKARTERLIAELVRNHPTGRILLVCHYGTHSALLTLLLNPPPVRHFGWRPIGPAAVTEVEVDPRGQGTLLRQNFRPDGT